MLLQGSQSIRRQEQARTEQPAHRRVAAPEPAPTVVVRTRNYPPITWDHPSLGKTVATGLGGISKTTALFILLGAVFVGTAMAIAIMVTSIVSAFGIDASSGY
ncbi:hypothetical protein ACIA5D_46920 [Actinoplanes sp. NPDC051513]|uniref:hypothetical protein n=1 Tax=Actinoplanes sp. NPDC051513 TaxID=3363908 RepID=UPI0037B2E6B3